jgi:hypothetical protein
MTRMRCLTDTSILALSRLHVTVLGSVEMDSILVSCRIIRNVVLIILGDAVFVATLQ